MFRQKDVNQLAPPTVKVPTLSTDKKKSAFTGSVLGHTLAPRHGLKHTQPQNRSAKPAELHVVEYDEDADSAFLASTDARLGASSLMDHYHIPPPQQLSIRGSIAGAGAPADVVLSNDSFIESLVQEIRHSCQQVENETQFFSGGPGKYGKEDIKACDTHAILSDSDDEGVYGERFTIRKDSSSSSLPDTKNTPSPAVPSISPLTQDLSPYEAHPALLSPFTTATAAAAPVGMGLPPLPGPALSLRAAAGALAANAAGSGHNTFMDRTLSTIRGVDSGRSSPDPRVPLTPTEGQNTDEDIARYRHARCAGVSRERSVSPVTRGDTTIDSEEAVAMMDDAAIKDKCITIHLRDDVEDIRGGIADEATCRAFRAGEEDMPSEHRHRAHPQWAPAPVPTSRPAWNQPHPQRKARPVVSAPGIQPQPTTTNTTQQLQPQPRRSRSYSANAECRPERLGEKDSYGAAASARTGSTATEEEKASLAHGDEAEVTTPQPQHLQTRRTLFDRNSASTPCSPHLSNPRAAALAAGTTTLVVSSGECAAKREASRSASQERGRNTSSGGSAFQRSSSSANPSMREKGLTAIKDHIATLETQVREASTRASSAEERCGRLEAALVSLVAEHGAEREQWRARHAGMEAQFQRAMHLINSSGVRSSNSSSRSDSGDSRHVTAPSARSTEAKNTAKLHDLGDATAASQAKSPDQTAESPVKDSSCSALSGVGTDLAALQSFQGTTPTPARGSAAAERRTSGSAMRLPPSPPMVLRFPAS